MTIFAISQWSETVFAVLQKRPDRNGYNLAHPEAKFASFADAVNWTTNLPDATIILLDAQTLTERTYENGDDGTARTLPYVSDPVVPKHETRRNVRSRR